MMEGRGQEISTWLALARDILLLGISMGVYLAEARSPKEAGLSRAGLFR